MIEYLNSYDKLIESTRSLIQTLKAFPKIFKEKEHQKYHSFFDKALYNVLHSLDLVIGMKYLDLSKSINNQVETNYFARVLVITCHEILNDLNKMVGKDLRTEFIAKIGANDVEKLDQAIKEMNGLRKKYLKKLKGLRNNVFAHKLDNGIDQANIINEIIPKDIHIISNEIWKTQAKFIRIYTDLMQKI